MINIQLGKLTLNTVYNIDCLIGMQDIPDGSIDMILCDLPYGQTSNEWDSIIPLDKLWEQYNRIIKENGAIVLTAKGKFFHQLVTSNINNYRYEWVWNKNKGANFAHVKRMPLNSHEYVVVFYKKQPTYNPQMTQGKPYKQKREQKSINGIADNLHRFTTVSDGMRYPKTIIEVEGMAQRHIVHPTQKPVALFEYLINTYTNEGDVVLDNCMGSGTTAIAAINTGRKYIGFELEKEYFDITNKRIAEALHSKNTQ